MTPLDLHRINRKVKGKTAGWGALFDIVSSAMMIVRLSVLLSVVRVVASFSASSSAAPPWQNFFGSLFPEDNTQRILKQQLLSECRQNIGYNSPEIRQNIESIIYELCPFNPTQQTATSDLLKKKWIVEWTSEKEINFFLEKGISKEIIQTLDGDILENYIPFVKGGGFGVTGKISVDEDASEEVKMLTRTNFKFKNAKLDLGKWGEYNFPPVGEGWFDTIYLDDGKLPKFL